MVVQLIGVSIGNWQSIVMVLLMAYLPGIVLGGMVYLILKRFSPMPLYALDLYGAALPAAAWFLVISMHWCRIDKDFQSNFQEVLFLGWIWGLLFLSRLLVPFFTHRIRFRLAAIHVGTVMWLLTLLSAFFMPMLGGAQ